MFLFRPFFSAGARVFVLRVLLLADVAAIAVLARITPWKELHQRGTPAPIIAIASAVVIFVHHILGVFSWNLPLAIPDALFILLETILFGIYSQIALTNNRATWGSPSISSNGSATNVGLVVKLLATGTFSEDGVDYVVLLISSITVPILLFFLLVFRLVKMFTSRTPIFHQRHRFLGRCAPTHPAYTPATILFTRGLARPLVRGENGLIILLRCLVILALGVMLPAFAIYSLVILPATASVYTREIIQPPGFDFAEFQKQTFFDDHGAVIGLPFAGQFVNSEQGVRVTVLNVSSALSLGAPSSNSSCNFDGDSFVIRCAMGWQHIVSLTITAQVPNDHFAQFVVAPWYQKLPGSDKTPGYVNHDPNDPTTDYPPTIPVLAGTHAFAELSWTARHRLIDHAWTMRPKWHNPVRFYEDVRDTSTLSGIANVGGFWTFVNGAFVLIFGANFIYFAFGRRPLSALGVIHIFQRRSLTRRWHEDFPLLESEGGMPGSENAGIVAFIRERLVDVESDGADEDDEEASLGRYKERVRGSESSLDGGHR
ncbi:Short-chain dehydrogenase/reductase family protein [Mycena kentingensis (nom. inval.)]|nr:Short-chain dehydrogenase/reductase family protein [Mycena kentingensis (nom. inval.)]